jgi:hypothetical protein
MGCLFGISHIKFNIIGTLQWQEIVSSGLLQGGCNSGLHKKLFLSREGFEEIRNKK